MDKKPWFPYLLVLAVISAAIEVDISLPSFPDIARAFDVSEEMVERTISLNFLACCFSALFYGPISDRWGRRPVLLGGTALFLAGSIGCALAPSIELIILSRFIQGLGAGSAFVVSFTMLSDVYQGEEATGWIGFLNATCTAVMAGAPLAGAYLNSAFGWRACYTAVALLCSGVFILLALFLPETRPGQKVSFKRVRTDYSTLLGNTRFLQAALVPTLLCGGYMAFVTTLPFLYRDALGMTLTQFAVHQAFVIASFSIVSFNCEKVTQWLGVQQAATWGLTITAGATALLFGISLVNPLPSAMIVTPLMCVFAATCAVAFAVVFAESLEVVPGKNGPASSLIMSMRTLFCAASIQGAALMYNGTIVPIASVVSSCCLASLLLALRYYQQKPLETVAA